MSQFSELEGKETLARYIQQPSLYPAGRLDFDSEGLLLLTDNGQLQHLLTDPKHKLPKTYWVQVEGEISAQAIQALCSGVELKDGMTLPAQAKPIEPPALWERTPPIRYRAAIPTSWLELTITEGRNRQVRRMTAAVGYPTLRLVRVAIGPWSIQQLNPGEMQWAKVPDEIAARIKPAATTKPPYPRKPQTSARRPQRSQRSRAR